MYNTPLVLAMPKSILTNDGPASAGGKLEFVEVTVDVPAADGPLDWIRPNGTFHFTPTRGFRGNTTFTYRECQRAHAHAGAHACVRGGGRRSGQGAASGAWRTHHLMQRATPGAPIT